MAVRNCSNNPINPNSAGSMNKFDFLRFETRPISITRYLSSLLNYMNCLFLLDYVCAQNNYKIISKLLQNRGAFEAFKYSTTHGNSDRQMNG